MAENSEQAKELVNLAAEGMVPAISGCASALASARQAGKSAALGAPPTKAVNYFGPRIVERWLSRLGSLAKDEQMAALVHLSTMPLAEARNQAQESLARLAPDAAPEDKEIVLEYLSAIPLMVRNALVHDTKTDSMVLPTTLDPGDGPSLIGLLPPEVPPFAVGTDLPGTTYQLEELLGIGGFGAVYKAKNRVEQNQPPRAIKFCLDPSMVASLHRERSLLDRLKAVDNSKWSTRIVRLYGYALDADPPFLIYEFVPGGDLTHYLRVMKQKTGTGLTAVQALDLIRQVAQALAFAHQQGLVHRDLKPANVLMVGSKIKLTDFGIGGVISTHAMRGTAIASQMSVADQTCLFRGSGTPLYMSPEQRRGDTPDPRHDLFSLGVMWYQLLVGDVSRELHPGWPDELTEEFHTPPEHIEIIRRCVGYFKKRPANGAELVALIAPLVEGTTTHSTASISLGEAPSGPPPSFDTPTGKRVDPEFERLKQILSDQIDKDALSEARETVLAMLRIDPTDAEAQEIRAFLDEKLSAPLNELHVFTGHQGWVRSAVLSADGKRALSGSDDKTLILWDLDNRSSLRSCVGHTAAVMNVAFSIDGQLGASGSWDGSARVWELNTGRELHRFQGKWKGVKCVAFAPDGKHLILGADDHKLHLFDLESGQEVRAFEGHADLIHSVVFSPDGSFAVSGSDDSKVHVWDINSGVEVRRLTGHADSVTSVAISPNGRWVLSGSSDHSARLWDAQNGNELRRFDGHRCWVNSVAFSPKELRIVTGSGGAIVNDQFQHGDDKTVRVWDVRTEREVYRFDKHQGSVTSVAFMPTGRMIVSGSLDKTVRLLMLPQK